MRKPVLSAAVAGLAALVFAASASAHARMSPAVSLANELQLYSLAIPTEKAERDDDEDRPDPAEGLLDRLVRARAPAGSGSSSRPARATAP